MRYGALSPTLSFTSPQAFGKVMVDSRRGHRFENLMWRMARKTRRRHA